MNQDNPPFDLGRRRPSRWREAADRAFGYRDFGRLWRVYGRGVVRYATPRKLLNAARTEWDYRRRRVDAVGLPYVLFVEPLYHCNLACPLCDRVRFAHAREAEPRDLKRLDLNLFGRVMDELGPYLFQCHIFGVGEPLLDWPLSRRVIEMAHGRRVFTLLCTNATPITPRVAEEIVASGLDHLVFAIDGLTQDSYGRYRVGGDVAKALRGMELVVEQRRRQRRVRTMELEWQYLVNRHNAGELEAATALARRLGVTMRPAPLGGITNDELSARWLPEGPEWADYRVSEIGPATSQFAWPCYWLWRGAVLNSNGTLGRCPGFQTVATLGDLRDGSVADLYHGPQSRRSRELFARGPVADGPFPMPCDRCSAFPRRRGGPPAEKAQVVELTLAAAAEAARQARAAGVAGFVAADQLGVRRARPTPEEPPPVH